MKEVIRADDKSLGKKSWKKISVHVVIRDRRRHTVGEKLVHGKNEREIRWKYMNWELEKEGAEHLRRMKKRKKNKDRNEEKRR